MNAVTLTYADGSKETVALVGSVRVEIDSDTAISRLLSPGSLVKVELSDKKVDTESHAAGSTVNPEPAAEPEAEPVEPTVPEAAPKKKSTAKKSTAKKGGK